MQKRDGLGWTMLLVFTLVLGYFGVRALHFNYPTLFIGIVIAGTMLIVLAFSFVGVESNSFAEKSGAKTAKQASEMNDGRRSVNG